MLTPLGKALRKMRIDNGWLLKDMAEGIGVSAAFLSSVETGKKSAPTDLVEKISTWAKAAPGMKTDLLRAAAQSTTEIRFRLPSMASSADREAAAILARTFEKGVDADFLAEVRELVGRKR